MNRLITDNDRNHILDQLQHAPDEVLVRAYQDFDAQRVAAVTVRNAINKTDYSKLASEPSQEASTAPVETDRPNVNPGAPLIGKIGSTAKEEIFKMLDQGLQPPAKYKEHCKLLWSRDEIKFDGERWYL